MLAHLQRHLKPGQLELMRALGEDRQTHGRCASANPYDLLSLPSGAAGVAAWEYTAQSLEALVPFLKRRDRRS